MFDLDVGGWLLAPEGEPGETGGAAPEAEPTGGDRLVPVAEFSKLRKQYKEARDELAKIREDQEAAKQAAAAEQGRFKELWEAEQAQRETLAERVAQFEAREAQRIEALENRNAQRIAALPEGVTVPDAPPETQAALLDTLESVLKIGATATPAPAGGRTGNTAGPGAEELTGEERAWLGTAEGERYIKPDGSPVATSIVRRAFEKYKAKKN